MKAMTSAISSKTDPKPGLPPGQELEALVRKVKARIDWQRAEALFKVTRRIIERMRELKMTKQELAEALAVPPSQVSRILSGTNNFTVATLSKISEVLGCELEVTMSARREAGAVRKRRHVLAHG